MKHRFDAMTPRKIMVIAGSIVLYLIVLIVLLQLRDEESGPVFGSMEDRFLSDITIEYNGETYYYRENEITNYLVIGLDRENSGQAYFLVVLSIDRVNRTITPVMLDQDILEQYDFDADASEYGDMAQFIEELLYGVRINHYLVLLPEAAALLDEMFGAADDGAEPSDKLRSSLAHFRMLLADDTAEIIEWMRSLLAYISTNASGNTILHDIRTMAGYSWSELQTIDNASVDGTVGYHPEDEALRELVVRLWFHKET